MATRKRARAPPRVETPQWNEESLLSGEVTACSPLAELTRLYSSRQAGAAPEAPAASGVPVYSAEHEGSLLREPWASAGAPQSLARPCLFGRRCVGMRAGIPGHADSGGIVLAESMSPTDLAEFERTGAHPATRAPCVLCARANVMDAYMLARRAHFEEGAPPPPCVFNWFSNAARGDGAYDEEVCIPFAEDGDAWLGVVGRMAMFLPARLRMVQNPATHEWRVDQGRMLQGAQHFESDAAPGASALRRFLEMRPDIWDGAELGAPWPHGSRAQLRACAERRADRLGQLAAAYGLGGGLHLAAALAAGQDAAAALLAVLDAGADVEAARDAPFPAAEPVAVLAPALLRVASSFGARVRVRRKRAGSDNGRHAMGVLISRAVVEGSSSRSVCEAASRAAAEQGALSVIRRVVARALVGGYSSCLRRPSLAVRTRVAALSEEAFRALLTALPTDTPLVSAALIEAAAVLVDAGALPCFVRMCGGERGWAARVTRARQFMDTLRGGLEEYWAPGDSLVGVLGSGPLAVALRRVYRRSNCGAAARAAAGARAAAPPAAATSPAPPTTLIWSSSATASAPRTSVMVCMGCSSVKNFITRVGAPAPREPHAAGYPEVSAPNLLEANPEPHCVSRAECATASLHTVRLAPPAGEAGDEFGDVVALSNGTAITISACCRTLCSVRSLRPCADGGWACAACDTE